MAFDAQFESRYIRQFAGRVQRGASLVDYSEFTQRICAAFSEIADPKIKKEAQERVTRISNYGFIYIEDPKGSSAGIVKEIEELADFVSKIT